MVAIIENRLNFASNKKNYKHIITHHDSKHHIMWCYLNSRPRPCFTIEQLKELNDSIEFVRIHNQTHTDGEKIRYHVMGSNIENVFSLGGDLEYFKKCIVEKNKEKLAYYAKICIEAIYMATVKFQTDVTSIALVQGDALGGGFETALACNVLIAEKSAKFGFPEIIFNLIPGMGAYNLLSRRINPAEAKRMILSGKIYTAEEMYEMGIIDVLVEDLQGEIAVHEYIKKIDRCNTALNCLHKVENICHPITYHELAEIADLWVDAALQLEAKDLKMMERLVRRQSSKY